MTLALRSSVTRIPSRALFAVPPSERAVVVGPTGSGKSELLYRLARRYRQLLVLDPKCEFRLPGARIEHEYRRLGTGENPRILYRPTPRDLGNATAYESFFWFAFLRKETMLVVDETMSVVDACGPRCRGMRACLVQGRSRGVGGLYATQRPSLVPLAVFSESRTAWVFALNLDDDRVRMEKTFGIPRESHADLPEHGFWFARKTGGQARIEGPYLLDLAGGDAMRE